jgi:PiT family inorganic phosphate transporter
MDAATVTVLFLVLAAEFVNGWTDAPNAIATVVSTRVLSPLRALAMASVFNLLGTMSGTAVGHACDRHLEHAGMVLRPADE